MTLKMMFWYIPVSFIVNLSKNLHTPYVYIKLPVIYFLFNFKLFVKLLKVKRTRNVIFINAIWT